MPFESTQPSLLSRVRDASDQAAWREFESKYRELILRYCRGRGLQQSDAEDVLQVVLISLSKSLRKFEYRPERGKFRGYLGRSVRNAIGHHLARPNVAARALGSSVIAAVPAEDEGGADEQWEKEWTQHHYRLAMQTIRQTYEPRSVEIFDRILMGDGIEDIASKYDMSTQAVHKVKQRIRERLKQLIAAQIRDEDAPDG